MLRRMVTPMTTRYPGDVVYVVASHVLSETSDTVAEGVSGRREQEVARQVPVSE